MHDSGGLQKAQQLAMRYTKQALSQIERLPESDMKATLTQLNTTIIRTYDVII